MRRMVSGYWVEVGVVGTKNVARVEVSRQPQPK
jgi:hypothetical protein